MKSYWCMFAAAIAFAGCEQRGRQDQPKPAESGAQVSPQATWKVPPTALAVIKADPPSYIGKVALVYVGIRPSDYFNFGYGDARNTHFAFELRPALEGGRIGPEQLYGYAERSWARPFFEAVTKSLESGKYRYRDATLLVAYVPNRYDGRSADHIEILAAEVGEVRGLDPAPVQERVREEQQKREESRKKDAAARTAEEKACPDERLLELFKQQCLGQFAMGRLFGGGRPQFDTDYFCRCAARRVNLKHVRESTEDCAFINTADLADYLGRDSTVLACRR